MLDLIIKNATIPGRTERVDIGCMEGRIESIIPNLEGRGAREIDAEGNLVCSPFVDPHFHMDACLSLGLPRLNRSGTLLEGIKIWGELKPDLTAQAIKNRAMEMLTWSIARGTLAIRTHVDVCDPSLMAVDVLLEIREEMKDLMDIQIVAFPQDGVLRSPGAKDLLVRALDKGVDVVGGIPHFERTMDQGRDSVRMLCEIAAHRGLMVDMHCDENDDPLSRHVESLAYETTRLGLAGRVTGSHLASMHSMDNYYVTKLIPLMAEAGLHCICNPLINIALQGRQDTYPKRRGLTRVPELMAGGLNVALGHDCVMDPWYPMGSHDMLEVAHMAAHCLHMMGVDDQEKLFAAVTENGARVMDLPDYGLEPGCNADLVLLQAGNIMEAIRLKPPRLAVIRRGRVVAESEPVHAKVHIHGKTQEVDFRLQREPR